MTSDASASQPPLSTSEQEVLAVFRRYLMTPDKMLCFSSKDLDTFRRPLAQLIEKQLVVAERFRGGYSLTDIGFAVMRQGGC